MDTKCQMAKLDLVEFYNFMKFSLNDRLALLQNQAVMIDQYSDKEALVKLWVLNGFFVEEIIYKNGNNSELLPFKQGYKLQRLLAEKGLIKF